MQSPWRKPAISLSGDDVASVLWFTGLSGAGKSTIASAVADELRSRGLRTEYLDGDVVRLFSPAGFSPPDRDAHVKRIGFIASRLEHHGVTVVCAVISPYAESRGYVRRLCRHFVEIYVATPLAECERRDPKGLYRRARRGQITQFTGIDAPYEPPATPELVLDTTATSVQDAIHAVLATLDRAVASSRADTADGGCGVTPSRQASSCSTVGATAVRDDDGSASLANRGVP